MAAYAGYHHLDGIVVGRDPAVMRRMCHGGGPIVVLSDAEMREHCRCPEDEYVLFTPIDISYAQIASLIMDGDIGDRETI